MTKENIYKGTSEDTKECSRCNNSVDVEFHECPMCGYKFEIIQ